uniref:Uncharacterized protein n=1 Tax=Ixodes ricinus TaxID=34613 RepID=A0A6B0URW8_IXORI
MSSTVVFSILTRPHVEIWPEVGTNYVTGSGFNVSCCHMSPIGWLLVEGLAKKASADARVVAAFQIVSVLASMECPAAEQSCQNWRLWHPPLVLCHRQDHGREPNDTFMTSSGGNQFNTFQDIENASVGNAHQAP